MKRERVLFGAVLALGVVACGPSNVEPDAGVDAASPTDAPVASDTPPVSPDAGSDAPFFRPDGGPTASALEPLDACDDVVTALYDTPEGLPAFDPSVRGALLGCSLIETIEASEVATRLAGVSGIERVGGALRVYVIAYRTEREPRGVGGISTALMVLPDVTRSERVPVVLALHGTVGIADPCAPSRFWREGLEVIGLPASYVDAFVLSYAAAGLPVIAPDYAGLGTEGVHGYGNWIDPARSAIDGVRAIRALLPSERLDSGTLAYGHSQGGGIALSVAALASEDPSLDLRAVVSMAPGYDVASSTTIVRLRTFAVNDLLRATGSLFVLADYANLTDDTTRWGEPFEASIRDTVVSEWNTRCFVQAGAALGTPRAGYVPPNTVDEVFDDAFIDDVTGCVDRDECSDLTGAWVARDEANQPVIPMADAPPILMLTSTDDEASSPGAIGCVVNRLRDDMTEYDFCEVDGGDHLTMVSTSIGHAIDWSIARASGEAPPACPGSTTRPRCTLL